jgi:predicted Zn-dependent protease
MKEKILASLKRLNIEEYIINVTSYKSAQMFFVKKSLDCKRAENTKTYNVRVYRSFEKNGKEMKGSSSVFVYDGMTDEEIDASLGRAYLAASFVCNPTFELMECTENKFITMESGLFDHTLEECCEKASEALFAEDNRSDAFINSAEIFAYETNVEIISSTGIDSGYTKRKISGEFVAQCKEPQDVETYKDFQYYDLDCESLKSLVRKTLEYTLERAKATQAPKAGKYRVIISDHYVCSVFSYYMGRAQAPYIYAGYSTFEVGQNVQAVNAEGESADVKGDKVSMTLVPTEPMSDEGIWQQERELLDEGVLKTYHGGLRFSRYLGIEPTGYFGCIKVAPGSMSVEDMKKEPYLWVVNFSDFTLDDFTGHFGGEIRLAFLFDGEKVTPVTGGSINGSIIDSQTNMHFSKEIQKSANFMGPYAMCFEDVSVAGV